MLKKIALYGIGATLLINPLVASAQTVDSTRASLIATLTALVQQLELQLQQLLAARANPPHGNGQPSLCATYSDLQRGNTDATTNGRVSLLQAALGISPTTG